MLGREHRRRLRRMLSVPTSGVISAVDDTDAAAGGSCSVAGSFVKDIRKINIGDCALFKPPQDSPPFIGIIRSFETNEVNNLHLGVNWLYRPADVQLIKGVAVEAAPNEVFYSFHRDEIPSASLLHPCKVAFLPKGVDLPPGVSSFVCRQVYDIANKRLWWLTDKDFINDRQEEVDKLLQRTESDMHATVQQQQGGRSPKPSSSPMSASQIKHSPDSVQNSTTACATQMKGKKRERSDQGSDPIRRERCVKLDDGDSSFLKSEGTLKSEIAKITEKGGLVNSEAVERFVHLLRPDKSGRKIDLTCRCLLAGVIAATDKDDLLNRFVQLKGLLVLDEWLQEVHKGKVGDANSPMDHDRLVEEFLLILLRALGKLPVNLNALQMSNIGKSVNHLRSHRNSDIQKKARTLVDTWKKRVEAEMNVNDTRSSTAHAVPWPGRIRNDVSCGGSRHASASEASSKNLPPQLSSSKSAPVKMIQGEVLTKSVSMCASPTLVSPVSTGAILRDSHVRIPAMSGSSELPLSAARDEKSSSSSPAHTNSQCSSDPVKNVGLVFKEDARSSSSGNVSRHRKTANGVQGANTLSAQQDVRSSKNSLLTKISVSEKISQYSVYEKSGDAPVCDSNSHKLIVKINNRGRSSAQNVYGGFIEGPSSTNSRTSSPGVPEKSGQSDRSLKGKNDGNLNNIVSDMNPESTVPGNSLKDEVTAYDERNEPANAVTECGPYQTVDEAGEVASVRKAVIALESVSKSRKALDSSLNSINALIESCVKFSEANVPMSAGDEVGMNLLASVAAGEIPKSAPASPVSSPLRSYSRTEESCRDDNEKLKPNGDMDVSHGLSNQPTASAVAVSQTQDILSSVCKEEKFDPPQTLDKDLPYSDSFLRSDEKPDESARRAVSVPLTAGSDVSEQGHETKVAVDGSSYVSAHNGGQALAGCLANEVKLSDVPLNGKADQRCTVAGAVPTADTRDSYNDSKIRPGTKALNEKLPTAVTPSRSMGGSEKVTASSCINFLLPGQFCDVKEDADVGGGKVLHKGEKLELKQEDNLPAPQSREDVVTKPGGLNKSNRSSEVDAGDRDASVGSAPQTNDSKPLASAGPDMKPSSDANDSKLAAVEAEKVDVECPSVVMTESLPAAGCFGMDGKLGFDLNEGFEVDHSKDQDSLNMETPGCPSSGCAVSPFPSSIASTSVGLPASITVAAAAKGSFVPPVDLLRNKEEIGWRGSAATSAFRPAEPRKHTDIPSTSSGPQVSDAHYGKHGRARLEIDLNVADEMEDLGFQNNDIQSHKNNDLGTNNGSTSVAPGRYARGLDLDLNRVDDAPEIAQPLPNNHRFEKPVQPVKLVSALSNSDSSRRNFDLNDGPTADDTAVESSYNHNGYVNNQSQPSVGFRINNADMGNLSHWYPAVSTFSAIQIPASLPDREQPFPFGSSGVPPRIFTCPAGTMQFSPDLYRGSVLSSSPSVPFPATQFQYPVFPFGTSFTLPPSSSLPAGSASFMDPSSAGRLCFPAVPSQLVGSAPNVSSQYPRPYAVSLSDVSNSIAVDNSRRRHGLDLNAGPGGPDVEGRDVALPLPPRPVTMGSFALTDEQARMYSMAGGGLKRKEPDGGWDSDRLNYKQPSWQ